MAKRKSHEAAVKGGRMPLERRLSNYAAGGRTELTPRQRRRAAHKAGISAEEVAQQGFGS